jgi:uncharacterized protein
LTLDRIPVYSRRRSRQTGCLSITERNLKMNPSTALETTWAMLLRTRRRNGEWVATPVNVAVDGDRAFFGTPANSGKVKRLRNFDSVIVGPCTARGKPTGGTFAARARLLEGEEAEEAEGRLRAKYPFVYRVAAPIEHRLKRTHGIFFEISGLRMADDPALGVTVEACSPLGDSRIAR